MTTNLHSPDPRTASCLWPVLAFLGSLALGLALTVVVIRSIPPEVPNPTEAYEGFGDAVMAMVLLVFGAVVSILVALVVAIIVAVRVNGKVGPTQDDPL
jgi:hypothetical protein